MKVQHIIGIDMGGTRIKGIVMDMQGRILDKYLTPTNDQDEAWKEAIYLTVQTLQGRLGQDVPVGISAPGLPAADHRSIAFMPGRLKGLENFIWGEALNLKAYVLNDAVAAMLAESRFGAARGRQHAVLITLGTGVGGAILIHGQAYMGLSQKAGHLGHMVVDDAGDPDVTRMPGSLEECIGNCTLEKRSLGRYSETHDLVHDYRKGDHFATWLWLSSVRKLSIGMASIINILSPECIILGGGIAEADEALFAPLHAFLELYEWHPGAQRTEIIKAQFSEYSGAIGAACFAAEREGIILG